jgi:hypothetical protein
MLSLVLIAHPTSFFCAVSLASEIAQDGFGIDCYNGCKSSQNSLIATIMGLVA